MARVLINHVTPYPDRVTGLSVFTWNTIAALVTHGRYDYVLATNWTAAAIPPEIRSLGLRTVHRQVPRNETRMLIANTVELPRLKRAVGADLIFHPQPTTMLAHMETSVAVVHDLYRVTHRAIYPWQQRLQWRFATARGFRRAAHVICVSNATRDTLVSAYPDLTDRSSVIHEASPIAIGANDATARETDAPYALMVANITPNKNVGLLWAALNRLALEHRAPRVILVGRDDIGLVPTLNARFPAASIEMAGAVSDDALRTLYANAKVYINTSLVEGFCLPILEAHTLEVPVICSDIPVLREVAGEGALFVDPGDADALAAAISTVFGDPAVAADLRERAIANARRFSWEKAARETEAVFDRVRKGGRAADRSSDAREISHA
ncbi:MAG: glycosyltransferase family 1 protein [Sphingomonadales bacterium]|nr:glycosyltransferase family 1 protein [Sphingomonadales bacterium]